MKHIAKTDSPISNSTDLICRAVASDFKLRGITHQQAADMLGVEKRTVSNQISGKRPFGKKSAQKYSQVFGYEEPFLLYGIGELKKRQVSKSVPVILHQPEDNLSALSARIDILERMVAMQNKEIARLKTKKKLIQSVVKNIKSKEYTTKALDLEKAPAGRK